MAESTHGMRGTGSYSSGQRPTNFGSSIKLKGSRITRADVKKKLRKKRK